MGCNASIVHLCAAYATFSSKGSRKIVVKTCLRMAKPPEYLGTAVSCHPEQAFFAQRKPAPSEAEGVWARQASRSLRCKTGAFWLASLLIRSPEANIPGRRPDLQHRTASVQITFRVERPRPPLVSFAGNVDVREVRSNVVPIAQVHAGAHRDRDVWRDVNRDVARGSFKHRIAGRSPGLYQLHDDASRSRLNPRRWNPVQFNPAAACVSLHMSFSRCEVDAAAAGFKLRRAANISQIDAAPAGFRFDLARTLVHLDSSAAGLNAGPICCRDNFDGAAARFRDDFPVGMMHLDRAASSMQRDLTGDRAHVDRAAARFRVRPSANVIEMHTAAATFRLHASGNANGIDIAALSFDLHQVDLARHVNGKLSREMPWPPPLPVAHNPRRVSAHVGR